MHNGCQITSRKKYIINKYVVYYNKTDLLLYIK